MTASPATRLRRSAGPRTRRALRRTADALLAPAFGSVRGGRPSGQVAVTFDDGPDPVTTPAILQVLEEAGARCTYFLLVPQAEQHPDLVARIRDAGHEIALHGLDHTPLPRLPHATAVRTLREARHRLEAVAGTPVRLYRPPYGAQSPSSLLAARRAGLDVVVWSADAADWEERPSADVASLGLARLADGGILLLHERLEPGPDGTAVVTSFDRAAMTRDVLTGLHAAGLRAVRVDELTRAGAVRTAWFR
ncbi:polysaccharide deacetylase family protein [Cellulomonas telluris]|uniref:polysaccharide deacetylase family protein n=1 Tax=Cellulomonas telluris TaxID=2306636 RepID=UPI0010A7FE56|nr:polysaccharide deacetylase family protein [Cellulomonas telluris]